MLNCVDDNIDVSNTLNTTENQTLIRQFIIEENQEE